MYHPGEKAHNPDEHAASSDKPFDGNLDFSLPESDELKRLYQIERIVQNAMENNQECIGEISVEMATHVLDLLRKNDEAGIIPNDLTAEEFSEIWNELKEIQENEN